MKLIEKWTREVISSLLLASVLGSTWSAELPAAVVNGVSLPAGLIDRSVKTNVLQGQIDSPILRNALKEEFIARELMVQESIKRGLDKQKDNEDALFLMRQNFLIDLLMQDEIGKNPITDAELKAEYDRQVKVMVANDVQQYQLATIVLENEGDARIVMSALRAGHAFESQAKAKSVDVSKDKGGELGWLLPDQMTPAIANVVVNLSVGVVSAAPIQVGRYWHVVKLLGKRAYQIPSYEESKGLVQGAIMQNRRVALLKKLQDVAIIKR